MAYYFSKPKFQIYKYSQEDIPPLPKYQQQNYQPQNGHYQQHQQQQSQPHQQQQLPQYRRQQQPLHTSVQIEPSQSFELKQTQNGYQLFSPTDEQPTQQITAGYYEQPVHQQPAVPVIVLRIPGPAKYAAHLQALLQQYLEIRAAEYIKRYQEEQQQQEQQHQQYHSDTGTQQYYYSTIDQSQAYPIDQSSHYQMPAYQNYEPTHQQQSTYPQETAQDTPSETDDQPAYRYQTIVQTDDTQQYQQPHQIYGPAAYTPSSTESTRLQISENFPSKSHTQVYFPAHRVQQSPGSQIQETQHQEEAPVAHDVSHDSHQQVFHPPLVYTHLHAQAPAPQQQQHHQQQEQPQPEQYQQEEEYQPAEEQSEPIQYYDDHQETEADYSSASEQNVITITQRPPAAAHDEMPYNYHAHNAATSLSRRSQQPYEYQKGSKRQINYSGEQEYRQKVQKIMNRMKSKVKNQNLDKSTSVLES